MSQWRGWLAALAGAVAWLSMPVSAQAQNSIQSVTSSQQAGAEVVRIEAGGVTIKPFDAMLYPSQDHAFTDAASWIDEYSRIERLFVRELRPAPRAAISPASAAAGAAGG